MVRHRDLESGMEAFHRAFDDRFDEQRPTARGRWAALGQTLLAAARIETARAKLGGGSKRGEKEEEEEGVSICVS